MIAPAYLLSAFFLDLAIGDPLWLPHPVRIMGRSIVKVEGILRRYFKDEAERMSGVLLVVAIVLPSAAAAYLLSRLLLSSSPSFLTIAGAIVFVYLVSTTLALRGLIGSARVVIAAVNKNEISEAQRKLAMIVGRDTDKLGRDSLLRATIETVSENLSDGFVAPLFYLVVGGLPAAIAYKAVNTLDSMVGYKNDRYLKFGWAAAKLDDVVNYIPARLTGCLIVAGAFLCFLVTDPKHVLGAARNSFRIMLRDGRNHTSPNSGISEAAMAGALGIRLGGPSTYGGLVVEKPYIGDRGNEDYATAATRALTIVAVSSCLAVALALAVAGSWRLS
jgi:adenosylcobinamide-phosphate synthase